MSEPTINFHVQVRLTQFRIPVELIKKNFKSIQKLIEKQKKLVADDVAKIKQNPQMSALEKLVAVRKVIKSFEKYEKRLNELCALDKDYRERLLARRDHLLKLVQYTANKDTPAEASTRTRDDDEDVDWEAESYLPNPTAGSVSGSGTASTTGTGTGEDAGSAGAELSGKSLQSTQTNGDIKLDLNNEGLIDWYRDETNLLITEYLIRSSGDHGSGGQDPAKTASLKEGNTGLLLLESLCKTSPDMRKLIDADLFYEFNQIHNSITVDHSIAKVTEWFTENKLMLKKINSNMDFEIKYCNTLSLIEQNQIAEAIKYSQDNLSLYGNKGNYTDAGSKVHVSNLDKMQRIGGLFLLLSARNTNSFSTNLVMNSNGFKEYDQLLRYGRWKSLAECFHENFILLYGIPKAHSLFVYLSAGLSSLKSKSCYCNTENTIFGQHASVASELEPPATENERHNGSSLAPTSERFRGPNQYYRVLGKVNNCPVCSPELFKLSERLPYGQLITKIFNNPFKLPNGNIYPFDKLLQEEQTNPAKNELLRSGKIEDPLTREIFEIDDCVRVYPA